MPNPRPQEEDWFKEFQRVNAPSSDTPQTPLPRSSRPEDRRRHSRFEVDEASATLYREGLLSTLGIVKSNKARTAIDLSEGGARLIAAERIAPGTRVRIRIEMDKFKDAIEATGVVRWCYQSAKRPNEFFAGAMFVDLPPAQLKKIALMREWFNSPQCRVMRETRQRQKDSGFSFPK